MKIIKNKSKNLRSVYQIRYQRKINSLKRSGAGAADVYKPPMSWFTEMVSFMADTDDYRETVESDLVESDKSTQNIQSPPAAPTPTPTPSTIQKEEKTVGVVEALNRLQNMSSVINNRSEEDEFHFFRLNVASQLQQLQLYEALGVRNEIQAVLTAAKGQNMYPNLFALKQSVFSISNTQIYTYSPLNIQLITSTFPALNMQTNTLQSSNIKPINYSTLSASNTQANMPLNSNIQPVTCASNYSTLPPSNIEKDADNNMIATRS